MNIYDYDSLINILISTLSDIVIIPVTAHDFKEWGNLFDTFFKIKFKPNTIYPNHCFSFDEKERFIMSYKVFIHDPESHTQYILQSVLNPSDISYRLQKKQPKSKSMNMEVYNKTMCQLYDQHRAYLPDHVQDIVCKKPPPKVWKAYIETKHKK